VVYCGALGLILLPDHRQYHEQVLPGVLKPCCHSFKVGFLDQKNETRIGFGLARGIKGIMAKPVFVLRSVSKRPSGKSGENPQHQ
jgi:hypothetical protein